MKSYVGWTISKLSAKDYLKLLLWDSTYTGSVTKSLESSISSRIISLLSMYGGEIGFYWGWWMVDVESEGGDGYSGNYIFP